MDTVFVSVLKTPNIEFFIDFKNILKKIVLNQNTCNKNSRHRLKKTGIGHIGLEAFFIWLGL